MLINAFPSELASDVQAVYKLLIEQKTYNNVKNGVTEAGYEYTLFNEENIILPYRIYYKDIPPALLSGFSAVQLDIYHCIYSRCCDGFVREKHTNVLLSKALSYWTFPYIVKISDEYVIDIVKDIYEVLNAQDTTELKKFCQMNIKALYSGYSRMVSYWDVYYRRKECLHLQDYVGKKLFSDCFEVFHP